MAALLFITWITAANNQALAQQAPRSNAGKSSWLKGYSIEIDPMAFCMKGYSVALGYSFGRRWVSTWPCKWTQKKQNSPGMSCRGKPL